MNFQCNRKKTIITISETHKIKQFLKTPINQSCIFNVKEKKTIITIKPMETEHIYNKSYLKRKYFKFPEKIM